MLTPARSRALIFVLTTGIGTHVNGDLLRSAQAATAPLAIGNVSVADDSGVPREAAADLSRALRTELHQQLASVTGLGPLKRPLIVNATLTQVSSERGHQRSKASVSISIALSRADDRVLFAELRGRASVEEASGNVAAVRRAAVQGAVHGALARLPEAVQRAR